MHPPPRHTAAHCAGSRNLQRSPHHSHGHSPGIPGSLPAAGCCPAANAPALRRCPLQRRQSAQQTPLRPCPAEGQTARPPRHRCRRTAHHIALPPVHNMPSGCPRFPARGKPHTTPAPPEYLHWAAGSGCTGYSRRIPPDWKEPVMSRPIRAYTALKPSAALPWGSGFPHPGCR